MVHPFDDPFVVAGQGTVGVEILEGLPGATRIYVSIGGGGFIGGIAMAIRTIKPEAKIIGVETHGADAMAQSLAAGELVELPAITSIARTLGAPKVSDFTFRLVRELVEEVIVVDDAAACLPARSAATGRASGRVDFGMAPRHQRRARPPGVAGRLFPSGALLAGAGVPSSVRRVIISRNTVTMTRTADTHWTACPVATSTSAAVRSKGRTPCPCVVAPDDLICGN